jgi:hypothetical protein
MKLGPLNIDLEPTPDFSSIQKFQSNINTFFPGKRHCGITFWESILILVDLDFFTPCIHIDSQDTRFGAEGFELLLSNVEREASNVDEGVHFGLVPFLLLFLCRSFGLFAIALFFCQLLFGEFSFFFLLDGFFIAFKVVFLIELG